MKFKKDGNVFDTIQEGRIYFCNLNPTCSLCCLKDVSKGHGSCSHFCEKNIVKSARMMGFEIIKEEKKPLYEKGDYVRIIGNHNHHLFREGEIVKVLSVHTNVSISYICLATDDATRYSFVRENDLERVTNYSTQTEPVGKPDNGKKPRICEILGVDVGEVFSVEDAGKKIFTGSLSIDKDGDVILCGGEVENRKELFSYILSCAINNPKSIVKWVPKLTRPELEICKLLGAKWISKEETWTHVVQLWDYEPRCQTYDGKKSYEGKIGFPAAIASISPDKFPSLNPGDLLCVEDIENA